MTTYTIILSDNTQLSGFKNIDYAGYNAYGKETRENSGVFPVEDIYYPEDLKEILAE